MTSQATVPPPGPPLPCRRPRTLQGALAEAYTALLKQLWRVSDGESVPASLREVKAIVSAHAPMFGGYRGGDASELLPVLLDYLHEDLNRVRRKPYVASVTADGRPDAVVAAETRHGHRTRHDSVVADTVEAWVKCRSVCPVCAAETVTFEPTWVLSVPVPPPSVAAPGGRAATVAATASALSEAASEAGPEEEPPSLLDCLRGYCTPTVVGETDMCYCAACRSHERVTVTRTLWSTPDVLVVSLQRGALDGDSDARSVPVDCPVTGLDLSNLLPASDASSVYDLVAATVGTRMRLEGRLKGGVSWLVALFAPCCGRR